MKLSFSGASPYVRKAMACAILRGIDGQLSDLGLKTADAGLAALNPLGKIPTLVTAEGVALYDSPVICEYLDSIGFAPKLFPEAGPARWKALQLQALGDGIMDASQPRRREIALPQDDGRKEYIATQRGKVERALDKLEAEAGQFGSLTTIGEITVACALGYLDFRYANEPWRAGRPKLEAWYAKVLAMPALARTMPVA
ncbi:glutathione S-transferase [Roseococcus sp. SYP-B2431]|uniref:glutathione S-transferase C-terminal domain-containing protein n=1 Tax=Roseococcus sp. SYP-B2431 TaxID=2496640 RepID=UPI00103EDC2E|nr:glutathione S-transferase C-terminal domain-containing protein [Roseococcus sp. SYP-B2431]TCH99455.1 glutathione S-transferase [Roseococcus sp. SYP-B2431]